jgi:hypothetical protein
LDIDSGFMIAIYPARRILCSQGIDAQYSFTVAFFIPIAVADSPMFRRLELNSGVQNLQGMWGVTARYEGLSGAPAGGR